MDGFLPWKKLPDMALFDRMIREYGLKNDSELAYRLGFSRSYLSRIRNKQMQVSPEVILRVHDLTGWPVKQIKGSL